MAGSALAYLVCIFLSVTIREAGNEGERKSVPVVEPSASSGTGSVSDLGAAGSGPLFCSS